MEQPASDREIPRRISATSRPESTTGGQSASDGSVRARARSDRALAELAVGQHGVLTLAQLQRAGLSARAVCHRATAGRLARVHAGVYAVGPPTAHGRWMAAILACGPDALVSHRSAAALWGLTADPVRVEVTVRSLHAPSRAGLTVHRTRHLAETDVTTRDGLRCTSLARTLFDLASVLDRRALERAIDQAETLRVFDLDALRGVLARARGRRGTPALTAVLAGYSEPAISRSEAEERLLELIDSAGLPRPRMNAWIGLAGGGGYEADFLWSEARLIVEVDSRTYHARRRSFEHDRRRDRALALAGFETRRYAATELVEEPRRVAAELRAFLTRGGYRP